MSAAQYRRWPKSWRRYARPIRAFRGRIVGHSDIAPGRKTDPGPAFDWPYAESSSPRLPPQGLNITSAGESRYSIAT